MNGPKGDWSPAGPPQISPAERAHIKARQDKEYADWKKEQDKQDAIERRKNDETEKATLAKYKAMEPTLLDRRQKCSASLGILSNEIHIRRNRWSNAAIEISTAYEGAWNSFANVLGTASANNSLSWNIAFAALGSVLAGEIGVLCVKVGDKWYKDEARELFIAGATEAVNAGLGAVMNILPGQLSENYGAAPIPSPLTYKGELEELINDMESEMLQWCVQQQTTVKELPLADFEFFDPPTLDAQIAKFLEEKDSRFNPQPFKYAVQKAQFQNEVQKLMWGRWAQNFAKTELARSVIHHKIDSSIVDKLVEFGWVDDTGKYSDADTLKLAADWGPNVARIMRQLSTAVDSYHPQKFG